MTCTEIDASDRKHDFPTNARYKNSGGSCPLSTGYYLHNCAIRVRERLFFNAPDQLFRKKMVSIPCIRKQEEHAQRFT